MIRKKSYLIFFIFNLIIFTFVWESYAISNKLSREELIYTINQYINMADVLDRKNDKRVEYFKRASEFSKDLIKYYPNDDEGYAYLAYSLGSITREVPFYKKISVTKEVKKSIDKSLAINKDNHLAWFVAGVFYREASKIDGLKKKLAGKYLNDIIKDATFESSIRCFEKALDLVGENIQYRYELAKTYQDSGKLQLAIVEYKKILSVQADNKKSIIYQQKAQKKLKNINNLCAHEKTK